MNNMSSSVSLSLCGEVGQRLVGCLPEEVSIDALAGDKPLPLSGRYKYYRRAAPCGLPYNRWIQS